MNKKLNNYFIGVIIFALVGMFIFGISLIVKGNLTLGIIFIVCSIMGLHEGLYYSAFFGTWHLCNKKRFILLCIGIIITYVISLGLIYLIN